MTIDGKKEKIKTVNACFKCLKIGHSVAKCKTYIKCLICQKPHATIMCPSLPRSNTPLSNEDQSDGDQNKTVVPEIKAVGNHLACTNDVIQHASSSFRKETKKWRFLLRKSTNRHGVSEVVC